MSKYFVFWLNVVIKKRIFLTFTVFRDTFWIESFFTKSSFQVLRESFYSDHDRKVVRKFRVLSKCRCRKSLFSLLTHSLELDFTMKRFLLKAVFKFSGKHFIRFTFKKDKKFRVLSKTRCRKSIFSLLLRRLEIHFA